MAYAPRNRQFKIRWKIALPLLVLLLLCVYFFAHLLFQPAPEDTRYAICSFSPQQTEEKLNQTFEDTYLLSDYLFYGESLSLLQTAYDVEKSDDIVGKTVELVDVCDQDHTYQLSMEGSVDRKLPLDELEPGFYEVYVVDQLVRKRAVYASNLHDDHFTTIKRNGKVHRISLIADRALLKDFDVTLQDRYLFLEVKEEKPNQNDYDIMLDPSEYNKDYTNYVERGGEGNGVLEYEENYQAALELKAALEKYGLRVGITRDQMEDVVNTYGRKGRLAKAYQSNARYYFHIGLQEDASASVHGMEIYYSSHASAVLANALLYDLKANTELEGNPMYVYDEKTVGVIALEQYTGMDGRTVYDNDMVIREAGGKATQAGMYSENTVKGTASFAKDNLYGMQAISIYYGYVSNADDMNYWKANRKQIMEATAASIAKSLRVEESEE